ncbi:hypothetical protein [Pseudomonas sp. JH-2]
MGNRTEKSAARLADGESLQDSYRYASGGNRLIAFNGHTMTSAWP